MSPGAAHRARRAIGSLLALYALILAASVLQGVRLQAVVDRQNAQLRQIDRNGRLIASNQAAGAALYRRSVAALHATDYRLCVREQVDRAALDLARPGRPRLALYDCRPDLHGAVALRLSPQAGARLIARVRAAHNLP